MEKQLAAQIALNADVDLRFDDGSTLMASSAFISVFSSVLRGAVEANRSAAAATNSSGAGASSSSSSIPIPGVAKEDWVQAASFWYPVVPSPVIKDWKQTELLLRVGMQFDIPLLLHKVATHLRANIHTMTPVAGDEANIWHWIKQADKAGLRSVMPVLLNQAAGMDKYGCSKDANLAGLSNATLQQLIKRLVNGPNCMQYPAMAKRRRMAYPAPPQLAQPAEPAEPAGQ